MIPLQEMCLFAVSQQFETAIAVPARHAAKGNVAYSIYKTIADFVWLPAHTIVHISVFDTVTNMADYATAMSVASD